VHSPEREPLDASQLLHFDGLELTLLLPLPSWPHVLSPQQKTLPSIRTAHVNASPVAISTVSVNPGTFTGLGWR